MSEATIIDNSDRTEGAAVSSLMQLVNEIFGGSVDDAAVALGRETDQISKMLSGSEQIDEDLEMKVNGMLEVRGGDAL